jgi:hypothetical protein
MCRMPQRQLFVFLLYAPALLTACHPDKDRVEKIIIGINDELLAARKDPVHGSERWLSFCADTIVASYDADFTTSPGDVAHDLGDGIAESPSQYTFLLHDQTATLSYLCTSYELINKDTLFHHLRVTETFVYLKDQWKLISIFDALQPVNYTTPIADQHRNLYPSYAGVYQWKKDLFDSVFVIGGNLYSAAAGESPQLNFAVNDSEYMTKYDLGRVRFNHDRSGKVTSYTYTRHDGQKVTATKVK